MRFPAIILWTLISQPRGAVESQNDYIVYNSKPFKSKEGHHSFEGAAQIQTYGTDNEEKTMFNKHFEYNQILESNNDAEQFEIVTTLPHYIPGFENFLSDDSVRFKRDVQTESPTRKNSSFKRTIKSVNVDDEDDEMFSILGSFSENGATSSSNKALLRDVNIASASSRGPRGVTKEQWVKQVYPVRSIHDNDGNNYDDNVSSSSDVKAPSVQFITQRRLEANPSSENHVRYDREGRSRDLPKNSVRDRPQSAAHNPASFPFRPELPVHSDNDYDYYTDRHLQNYEAYHRPPFNPYRDDSIYRHEESRFDPQYTSREYDRYRPEFSKRQRRIIYYATLPEIVRTPPNVNLRDRYSTRDRFDDGFFTSPSLSVADRFRKPYHFTKPRYDDEIERTNAPYPLKVSTDVSVREIKKMPERRIYSEPDIRYAYKSPIYKSDENFGART